MSRNKKIILAAILLAMLIILSRFLSIKTPILKISFAFIQTLTGPYFIGYTISTALAGLIYGCLLYQKEADTYTNKQFILRVILAICLVAIFVNLGLNTLWTSITSGKAFMVLLGTRVIKELIMVPIRIVVILLVERMLRKPFDQYIRSQA